MKRFIIIVIIFLVIISSMFFIDKDRVLNNAKKPLFTYNSTGSTYQGLFYKFDISWNHQDDRVLYAEMYLLNMKIGQVFY